MKILQLGGGSMGTRRLRDLSGRADLEIRVFDARADRRLAAADRFGIKTFDSLAAAMNWAPDALIISTPPGTKGPFVELALNRNLHHFVEADIWSYGVAERAERAKGLVCAPSLTFAFLPVVQALAERLPSAIGTLLGYQFFLAGDMASWHPAEGNEYYGRHRDTAPAREMVPFELAWLAEVFGRPQKVAGGFGRFSGRDGAFEDTWTLQLQLAQGGTGQLTVTMACPHDFRSGCAFGVNGHATWDINRGEVALHIAAQPAQVLQFGPIAQVIDATYAAEINAFVDAIQGSKPWPHRYADYQLALATLAAAESSAGKNVWETIDPRREPAQVLARLPASL
ncbi:MAG: Gfo/Idh/MocA family oxidoreductase [Opitutaceae bacterium]